jgi:hypothetical protein
MHDFSTAIMSYLFRTAWFAENLNLFPKLVMWHKMATGVWPGFFPLLPAA